MTSATTTAANETTVRHRAVDTVREAEHLAHEGRLLKSLASDAVEDRVHAARRAITRGIYELEDLRDSATTRVRRAPLMTVGLALAGGILFGMIVGRFGRKAEAQGR